MIGELLHQRFRTYGVKACTRCLAVLATMNRGGAEWCERHKARLAARIDSNLQRHPQTRIRIAKAIPQFLRLRWIERQITIAIRQSRKKGQHPCTH